MRFSCRKPPGGKIFRKFFGFKVALTSIAYNKKDELRFSPIGERTEFQALCRLQPKIAQASNARRVFGSPVVRMHGERQGRRYCMHGAYSGRRLPHRRAAHISWQARGVRFRHRARKQVMSVSIATTGCANVLCLRALRVDRACDSHRKQSY